MFKDLFKIDDVIDSSDDFIIYGGVTFVKDFGPWKSGEIVTTLHVDYDEAEIYEEDEDGNKLQKGCKFIVQPVVE